MSAPSATLPPLRSQENPPFYRDIRVIRWLGQIAVLAVVLGVAWWLYGNVRTNLTDSGLPTSYDFLSRRYGAAIPGLADGADYSILRAYGAGYLNTVRVILLGIPAATLLGVVVGVSRLSDNAAARAFGTLYVETFRNIPVLLWIFLTHFVVFVGTLPSIEDAATVGPTIVSNRGIGVPWFNPGSSVATFVGFVGLALLGVILVGVWRGRVNARTGEPARGGLYGIGAFLVIIGIGHVISGNALVLDTPMIDGRLITGGITADIPYASLTIALSIYTASHIAEIVRGAIQAIPKGQTEAAYAVALSNSQRYRYVILPQAFRIMIPSLASQYLNLTKNSSLAVALGFIEITSVFQKTSANAAPAILGIIIVMGLYLTFSLGISLIANTVNRSIALETR